MSPLVNNDRVSSPMSEIRSSRHRLAKRAPDTSTQSGAKIPNHARTNLDFGTRFFKRAGSCTSRYSRAAIEPANSRLSVNSYFDASSEWLGMRVISVEDRIVLICEILNFTRSQVIALAAEDSANRNFQLEVCPHSLSTIDRLHSIALRLRAIGCAGSKLPLKRFDSISGLTLYEALSADGLTEGDIMQVARRVAEGARFDAEGGSDHAGELVRTPLRSVLTQHTRSSG